MDLTISFKKPVFKNFKELYFIPNEDIIYYDNSHLNYIYKKTIENIEYIFYGFYKDEYFIIICDSVDTNINIMIENKNILLVKLDWILKENINNKNLWVIDTNSLTNFKKISYALPIRNTFFVEKNLNINDYLSVSNYTMHYIKIKKTSNNHLLFIMRFLNII
jgi:hypothetical protein